MTYQDLIEELQGYTPEQLKQNVVFQYVETGDECSAEDVDWVTSYNEENQIVILA